jgi:hypothetical protein
VLMVVDVILLFSKFKNKLYVIYIYVLTVKFIQLFFLFSQDREVNVSVKLQRLLYLLSKALPVLRHIHREQSLELETEIKIRGNMMRNICR